LENLNVCRLHPRGIRDRRDLVFIIDRPALLRSLMGCGDAARPSLTLPIGSATVLFLFVA
jgi:hypothetical protein